MRLIPCAAAALAAGLWLIPRAPEARAASPDADRLYRRFCASCHGDDFTGSLWHEVKPEIPDFTSPAWHADRSDARLLASILDGRAGMPAFRRKLSEEQAKALVSRLRRAGGGAGPPTPERGPDDFDDRFEELIREIERLKKEFRECERNKEP